MTKSEMRAELRIWSDRNSKKNNAIPITKHGSIGQIEQFIKEVRDGFKVVKLDVDKDFDKIWRGAKRND